MRRMLVAAVLIALSGLALAQAPFDTSQAVPYDEGITWSWEEEVSPIDIYDFIESMPFNQWQVIDERTCRALFEDVIQKVLSQWGQPQGGLLDIALRERIFKFIPEYEYWWPVYEPDPEKREVKWPVKIGKLRNKNIGYFVYFKLGRPEDKFRTVAVGLPKKREELVYFIGNRFHIWRLQRRGEPQTIIYYLTIDKKSNGISIVEESSYKGEPVAVKHLLTFERGNPIPIVDNTDDGSAVDLSGLDLILSPNELNKYYNNWESFDIYAYQTFRSIIDLCKLQLNLTGNGQELEKVLRRDFLEFLYYDRDTVSSKELEKYENMSREELIAELQDIRENATGFERNVRTAYAIYAIRRKLSQDNSDRQFATEVEKWLTYLLNDSTKGNQYAIDEGIRKRIAFTLMDLARESTTTEEVQRMLYEWGFEPSAGWYWILTNCKPCSGWSAVSIRRVPTLQNDVVVYKFLISLGHQHRPSYKVINVGFSKRLGQKFGLPWAILGITCIAPQEMEYRDRDGIEKKGVGEQEKNFEFVYTRDFLEGREKTDISAIYEELLSDPVGYTITDYEEQLVLFFDYGIPLAFTLEKDKTLTKEGLELNPRYSEPPDKATVGGLPVQDPHALDQILHAYRAADDLELRYTNYAGSIFWSADAQLRKGHTPTEAAIAVAACAYNANPALYEERIKIYLKSFSPATRVGVAVATPELAEKYGGPFQ